MDKNDCCGIILSLLHKWCCISYTDEKWRTVSPNSRDCDTILCAFAAGKWWGGVGHRVDVRAAGELDAKSRLR
jgi:hypothetical protein